MFERLNRPDCSAKRSGLFCFLSVFFNAVDNTSFLVIVDSCPKAGARPVFRFAQCLEPVTDADTFLPNLHNVVHRSTST